MISIREYGFGLHPARNPAKRYFVLFHFYCDESYDGNANAPDYFAISGFFSVQPIWGKVEDDWDTINHRYGASSFHAAKLNGRRGQYDGWCKNKACEYSAELLTVINLQKGRMRAYNCGIRGDAYRAIISDSGRAKLGHPWIVCFNSCIAMIAKDMAFLPEEDRLSVIFSHERRFDSMAVTSFWSMSENPLFPYRHRLMMCAPGCPETIRPLQVADLMAFEYFKRLRGKDEDLSMRKPLELIREHNGYCEGFFSESTFKDMKGEIEAVECGADKLVIIPSL